MVALNFPNSPTVGQVYDPGGGLARYAWTGVQWNAVGTSVPHTWVSVTPPTSPVDGDFWWNPETGILMLRYNDGNSTQWVVVNPATDVAGLDTRYAQTNDLAWRFLASKSVPAANAQIVFTEFDLTKYRTYEFLFELLMPTNNTVTTVFAAQTSSDGGATWPGTGIGHARSIMTISASPGAYSAVGSVTDTSIILANNVRSLANQGLTGSLRLNVPPSGGIVRGSFTCSHNTDIAQIVHNGTFYVTTANINAIRFFFLDTVTFINWTQNAGRIIMLGARGS